ncbi:hypothetical protein CHELA20_53389 [Hyphomicrobiales bacterium]|nr:hypothetical protein CHELA41_21538 [Hyphomicrobiales bacterium]CAH1684152.1 hypothetical protein CHELA20_53389 [Hyphomicrobiales bacterium]
MVLIVDVPSLPFAHHEDHFDPRQIVAAQAADLKSSMEHIR